MAPMITVDEDPPSSTPPHLLLDYIIGVLSLLLVSSISAKTFVGRFRVLRAKLEVLDSSLSSLASSHHWSQNPLLASLLPCLLSTLQRLHSLSLQCASDASPSFPSGKLHFQSDLDMASSLLSSHLHDLDLLLRSGVLDHSTALVLAHPGSGSDGEQRAFFIRDLFTRLQIGGVGFKVKALESLLQILLDDGDCAALVSQEANVGYLISLLDFNSHQSAAIRDLSLSVVSLLASSSAASRKVVFDEGGLGHLLRILETGSVTMREKAAIAVEAISADPDNGWGISAYGGVLVLIEACRSGSPPTQAAAVGAIMNVAASEDVKLTLAENGGVPVLLHLLSSDDIVTQQKSANCITLLASSGAHFCSLIAQHRGIHRLMQCLLDESNFDSAEHVMRAVASLSETEFLARILSSSTPFVLRLGDLIKHGGANLQHTSALLLSRLSVSDGNKRAVCGCMSSLIKLMELPKPAGLSESAALALISLLTVKSNRKEFVRDDKSLSRLVELLNPKLDEIAKGPPIAVVISLLAGNNGGSRRRLVAAGARPYLQQLAEAEVPSAKKAAQKLAGHSIKNIIFSRISSGSKP